MALVFSNADVKKNFDMTSTIEKDFQVRVPALQWSGLFTDITPEVAVQLVKEKYNHIKVKDGVKLPEL